MADRDDQAKRAPYAKYAFANPYNLTLLGAAVTVAAATGNVLLGAAAAGAEAIWMLFAPDSRLLRKLWFDRRHAAEVAAAERARLEETLRALPPEEAARCRSLFGRKAEIDRLAAENPAFGADLLRGELDKLAALARAFVDMTVTYDRYVEYLRTVDLAALETDTRRYTSIVDHAEAADPRRQLALKNLDVLSRRRAKVAEIRQYIGTTRGQLDLIENTFQLLAEEIVTMRSPGELSGQLDSLMDGVEAVRQTSREAEKLFQAIEH